MITNFYELKDFGRCTVRRANKNLIVTPNTRTATEYSEVISVLKSLLHYKLNYKYIRKEEIEHAVEIAFDNISFETEQTKLQKIKEAQVTLKRYIYSEKRPYEFATVKNINLSLDLTVEHLEPDLIFRTGNTIEVVKFHYTKPSITRTGKKKDYAVNYSLQLYALHQYGRTLRTGNETVIASVYYLKRKNDDFKTWRINPDFFEEKDSSILSLTGYDNDIDKLYVPQVVEYIKGEHCSGDQCKNCSYADFCFTKQLPPEKLEEEKKEIKEVKLTAQQEKIVNFTTGIARVNACAGSGKTFVNMIRILNLIKNGANPEKILCITFTNSGAKELQERIEMYAPVMGVNVKEARKVTSTTFNSFGNDIAKENFLKIGYTKAPDTIDDVQSSEVLINIIKDKNIRGLEHLYKDPFMSLPNAKGILIIVKDIIDYIKSKAEFNAVIVQDKITEIIQKKYLGIFTSKTSLDDVVDDIWDIYIAYNKKLKDLNLIDYNDQENILKYISENYSEIIKSKGLEHIIIDEAQDSNPRQITIIKSLINCPSFKSLLYVGDDAQAIFAFRGATSYNLINFFDLIGKKGEDFYLTENFRSTNEITSLANDIVNMNVNGFTKIMKGKRENPNHIKPEYIETAKIYENITKKIKEKIAAGVKPNDMAFIGMKNSELQKMAKELTKENIPFITINPEPLLKNRFVIGGISYLKFFKDLTQYDATIYLNSKIDNFTEKSIVEQEFIFDEFQENILKEREEYSKTKDYKIILKTLEELSDDEIYLEFFDKIKDLFERDSKHLDEVCDYLVTLKKYGENKTARRKGKYKGIILTTAHSSKGLEWPIVFNSIEEYANGVPYKEEDRTEEQDEIMEETRRLTFVSFTRAQEELYIYSAYGRNALVKDVKEIML